MERILCLAAGYLCGLFQTGYLYGRMNHIDIRNYGSGNPGTTNALRVLGKKAGIIVFFGDFLKSLLPCLLVRVIFGNRPEMMLLYLLYTGLGVILGHNFPFYLGFHGGKGIAATAGLIVALDWRLTLVCLIVFVGLVAVTRYVSLGSIVVVIILFLDLLWGAFAGYYFVAKSLRPEWILVAAVICGMGIYRHRANIGRLITHKENKIKF